MCGFVAQLAVELAAQRRELIVLAAVHVEERRVVENAVQPGGALERHDLADQFLARPRSRHAFDDDFLAGIGHFPDLQRGVQDCDEQRDGDQRQAE